MGTYGEDQKTEGQGRGSPQQEVHAGFVLGVLVVGVLLALLAGHGERRQEDQVAGEVADTDGDERETDLRGAEVPLVEDDREGLDEHEDEGVGETGQQRQSQDNGLSQEHAEGPEHGVDQLAPGEALAEGLDLVGAVDVGVLAGLSAALGDFVPAVRVSGGRQPVVK